MLSCILRFFFSHSFEAPHIVYALLLLRPLWPMLYFVDTTLSQIVECRSYRLMCALSQAQYTIIALQINFITEDNIMASNEGRAYFALSGYHFNPDDITRMLGIKPTTTNAAGANSGLDHPVISSWELSTTMHTDDFDVYKLTDIITKQLEPIKDKLLQVIKSHNLSPRIGVVLVLSVDKSEAVPDVGFGARTVRLMAEIGAFINVDYQLSERI